MIYLNKEMIRDKINACWTGKNIGGTLGTPTEGERKMLDLTGFTTKPGEVLGNDDLDLQLIWMMLLDERGPENVTSENLGEYWLTYIDPYWNEYGVGKTNMKEGFFPPLSGELNNSDWKHSNGAWIRTEVWACLYPARPDKACEYAYADASVDHGYGEGSMAAIFVAAIESAAFVISDINTLLDIGLSKIPENCRIAQAVRVVRDAYEKGLTWQEARNLVLEDTKDIGWDGARGWFQAPLNIGFVVIGLLYGEGDFKKTVLTATNCGDDTDCTAATTGSIMGIMYGMEGIPKDWLDYIGDDIVTMSLNQGHNLYPQKISELTNIMMNLLPAANRVPFIWNRFHAHPINMKSTEYVMLTDEETDISEIEIEDYKGRTFVENQLSHTQYSFKRSNLMADVWVEYNDVPYIEENGTLTGKISIHLKSYFDGSTETPGQRRFHLRWFIPEGWSVKGPKNMFVCHESWGSDFKSAEFIITANENVDALNRLVLEVSTVGRLTPIYIPVNIMG